MHSSRRVQPRPFSFLSAKAIETLKFTVSICIWHFRAVHSWVMTLSVKSANISRSPFAPQNISVSGESSSASAMIR